MTGARGAGGMRRKGVEVDSGTRKIRIDVPEEACVAEFKSVSVSRDSEAAVRQALADPLGMPPLAQLVKPGMRITIAFDDPLRPPVTPRTVFPVLLEELARRGVGPATLTLISANGMHGRFTFEEFREYLGPATADAVGPARILNHDCTDEALLVSLGLSAYGGPVAHHRAVVESDLLVYVGNVAPNVWGGCGGMGAVVGLASAESIAHHHARGVIGAPESCHGDQRDMLYQRHKEAVAWQMQKASNRPIFYIESLTDGSRVLDVFAGHFSGVRDPGWEAADRAFDVPAPQADVLVVGLPQRLLYGETDNPLIALTGLGFAARMWKGAPVLRDGGVLIGVTESRGLVDRERHPSFEEVIRLYAEAGSIKDLVTYEAGYLTHRGYLASYQHGRGFHPAHPFWLFYENEYALTRAGRIIFAGAQESPLTRCLGIEVTSDFETAWAVAREVVGSHGRVIVAPTYWTRPRVKFRVTP